MTNYEQCCCQFAEDIPEERLPYWCSMLDLAWNPPPDDDSQIDFEDDIRGQLAEALMGVGK